MPARTGYYIMSDKRFDEFTYQVVVDEKYLTDEERAQFKQDADCARAVGSDGIAGAVIARSVGGGPGSYRCPPPVFLL